MENITIFDVAAIGLILFLGLKGILRGFIKEFFSFVGIIGGIFVGSKYAQTVGNYLDINFLHVNNKSSLFLIGFITVFLTFWIIATIIGNLLSSLISTENIIGKFLGFLVSSLKIFFIFSIMIYILSNINIIKDKTNSIFHKSFMYPIFIEYGKKIIKLNKNKTSIQKTSTSLEQNSSI